MPSMTSWELGGCIINNKQPIWMPLTVGKLQSALQIWYHHILFLHYSKVKIHITHCWYISGDILFSPSRKVKEMSNPEQWPWAGSLGVTWQTSRGASTWVLNLLQARRVSSIRILTHNKPVLISHCRLSLWSQEQTLITDLRSIWLGCLLRQVAS